MPTGPEAFLEMLCVWATVLRLDAPLKWPCTTLMWLVGSITNTIFLPGVQVCQNNPIQSYLFTGKPVAFLVFKKYLGRMNFLSKSP